MVFRSTALRIATIVSLFIVRMRFPASFSLNGVLRKRYGRDLVKEFRTLEKLDFEHKNATFDKMYGLAKIHKTLKDGIASFRPILAAIGTPTYNLAKFCDQLLKPLTSNDYVIKDSFSFTKEVLDFDGSCFVASFDIKSLFTNIPLTETLNLSVQNLCRKQTYVNNLTKSYLKLHV